jgi:hypothetical protein
MVEYTAREVTITVGPIDGRCRILNVNPLVIEAIRGDTIAWTMTGDCNVSFRIEKIRPKKDELPFVDPDPGATLTTLRIRARKSSTYKYDIVLSNGERLDPEIVIYDEP